MSEQESQEAATEEESPESISEQLGFGSPQEELDAIIARMDQLKEEVTADLLASWPSPWKNESMVSAKVSGRLGSHKSFQVLLARRRELEEELGTENAPRAVEDAEDPMGSYAINIAKQREAAKKAGS